MRSLAFLRDTGRKDMVREPSWTGIRCDTHVRKEGYLWHKTYIMHENHGQHHQKWRESTLFLVLYDDSARVPLQRMGVLRLLLDTKIIEIRFGTLLISAIQAIYK